MNLMKSEYRKIIYARSSWGLLLAAIFISALSTAVTVPILNSEGGAAFGVSLQETAGVDATYANAVSGYIFAIVLGVLIMAGEFRHGTAAATFLSSPNRAVVLAAKLAVAALASAAMLLVSALAGFGTGAVALLTVDNSAQPTEGLFLNLLIASVLAGAVLGIIGVAVGTLIRNQLIAIVSVLVYLFVIDPLLLALWTDVGKWLPSGLITAMLSIDLNAPELGFNTANYLGAIPAAIVLIGYGGVFAIIAVATSLRRDVD